MAYILTFLLFSLLIVGTLHGRKNLHGMIIERVEPQRVFAGEEAIITVKIGNHSSRKRNSFYINVAVSTENRLFGPFYLKPNSRLKAEIVFPTEKRGRFILDQVTLVTSYPFGFMQLAHSIRVDKEYVVFPKPAGNQGWPDGDGDQSAEGYHPNGGDDFTGLRPYRQGESQRHIDWKSYARGRPLSVKEFRSGGQTALWFDWHDLSGMEVESRLSQLTRWVLEADDLEKEFGLRLPTVEIQPDCCSTHTLRCLTELALFEQ
jgi:uncharacterized protein (DUF58 family)